MNAEEEGKLKASQIEAMQNRNGIDNWPFPQPRGWVAQWDAEGLAHALHNNVAASDKAAPSSGLAKNGTLSPKPCDNTES